MTTSPEPLCHCGDCLSCEVQAMRRRTLARRAGKKAANPDIRSAPANEYQALQMAHRGIAVRTEPGDKKQ